MIMTDEEKKKADAEKAKIEKEAKEKSEREAEKARVGLHKSKDSFGKHHEKKG